MTRSRSISEVLEGYDHVSLVDVLGYSLTRGKKGEPERFKLGLDGHPLRYGDAGGVHRLRLCKLLKVLLVGASELYNVFLVWAKEYHLQVIVPLCLY